MFKVPNLSRSLSLNSSIMYFWQSEELTAAAIDLQLLCHLDQDSAFWADQAESCVPEEYTGMGGHAVAIEALFLQLISWRRQMTWFFTIG